MPMDNNVTWGTQVASAVQGIGVVAGTEVTPAQLIQVWAAIKAITLTQLGKSAVAPGSFANGAGAVGGTGGPVT